MMFRVLVTTVALAAGLGCVSRVAYVPQPLPEDQDPLTHLELVLNQSTKPVDATFGEGYFRAVYDAGDSGSYAKVVTYQDVAGFELVGAESGSAILVVLEADGRSMASFLIYSKGPAESLADAIWAVAQDSRLLQTPGE